MIALVAVAAMAVVGLTLVVAKALAVDEARGRVQRRLSCHLENTIASLPEPLKDEWADEWRSELASIITMPLTAARFVRNVRRSAAQLVPEPALAPSRAVGSGHSTGGWSAGWVYRQATAATNVLRSFMRWMATPRSVDRTWLLYAITTVSAFVTVIATIMQLILGSSPDSIAAWLFLVIPPATIIVFVLHFITTLVLRYGKRER
ncbi:MAG TPA: hypothetical protein VK765_04765 [Solirubrobacteraceae bacterium]|jgi:hypothetical protein|nr:hypothetical protein [Solirubrobacteraceae bacterium]